MLYEDEQRSMLNSQQIKSLALKCGFDDCGVSRADHLQDQEDHLNHWLKNDYHGEMEFMERNIDKRLDPRLLVPNAKSVISVLLAYYPGNPEISTKSPRISRYAISRDYHVVLKDKLYQLLELMRNQLGKVDGRVFVDSAPVLEKSWAIRAGLGWRGKNSLLINHKFGSFVFIGELIVDIEIKPSVALIPNRCDSCTNCIDACPTGAIVSPCVIDPRKCISYLTIEKDTPLTGEEAKMLHGWCAGCDICQEVCPWNSKIPISKCVEIMPEKDVLTLTSDGFKALSTSKFEEVFSKTPLARTGWKRVNTNSNL